MAISSQADSLLKAAAAAGTAYLFAKGARVRPGTQWLIAAAAGAGVYGLIEKGRMQPSAEVAAQTPIPAQEAAPTSGLSSSRKGRWRV